MFTAIHTIEPSGYGTAFSKMGKNADRGFTYGLPESSLLSNHNSAIFELSPAAMERQRKEKNQITQPKQATQKKLQTLHSYKT